MVAQLNFPRIFRSSVPLLLLFLACLLPDNSLFAAAHPVSVTVSYVYVAEETVTVKMQVFLEDLYLFHNLQPNDAEFLDREIIKQGIELHKQFIVERFMIRDLAGDQLNGRVVNVQDEELPVDGVPLSDLMAHQIVFELEYDLSAPPEFLTFSQRFTDEEGMLPSEMKLIVKQENSLESETAQLRPDDLETVRFNWSLPPLSAEASQAERENWAVKQQEETLGITSYSSVYSFLYIEDHEVRHEILIPLLTLEQSVLIARDDDEFLDIAEQDAARQQIEAYFQSGNPIEIDGELVTGVVQRCDVYGLDFRDFAMQAERKSVPIITSRVGIILSYPARKPPQQVRLTWNRFNSFVWTINTVVFARDEIIKTSLSRLRDKNVFQWAGPPRPVTQLPGPITQAITPPGTLVVPVLSLIFLLAGLVALLTTVFGGLRRKVGFSMLGVFLLVALLAGPYAQWTVSNPVGMAPRVSEEEADAIFADLHRNLYQAFDYRTESEIYDVLALSTTGSFLRDVYLQVRKGLEMAEQGGAVARVRNVLILAGQLQPWEGDLSANGNGQAFAYRCRWNVAGTVEHWGHIHQRTNQYEAVFHVEALDGVWKVTQLELVDERRLEFETRLRGLSQGGDE